MSKFDDIKIPDSIDDITKKAMDRGHNYKKKQKHKKIIVASIASVSIGVGIIGAGIMNPSIADSIPVIRHIVDYFSANKESMYKSDEEEFEKLKVDLNLLTKKKGIEFKLDSASIDDNYLTIFYTIKTEKNIKEIEGANEDAYFANPFISAYINGKDIIHSGPIESEATFSSYNELKGMNKIDVSYIKIDDNMNVKFKIDEIFGIKGNWSVNTKIDKSKAQNDTYRYELDKDFVLNKKYKIDGKNKQIKNNVNIERVIISPLANKIVINEKVKGADSEWDPIMMSSFALFDQEGKSLDVIDKGGSGTDLQTGIATNSIEFLKADKNTKSLTLVPFDYNEHITESILDPQSIDNLPIKFKTSEYGNVVLEDIQITDKEIKYTYSKEGVSPFTQGGFLLFDENKNEILIDGGFSKIAIDRKTGKYTETINFEGYNVDKSLLKKVKNISTYTNNSTKLMYDQQMKIDLVK